MLSRRELLASAAAVGLAGGAPALAFAQAPAARLNAFFDAYMARQLRREPQMATQVGLDQGALAWTRSQLDDVSLEAYAQDKADTARDLAALRAVPRAQLSGMDAVNYDTVEFILATADEANRAFQYGGTGAGSPYMLGKLEWLRLREKARTALGSRFDIRRFHDAGLLAGPVPLTVLETVIDTYVASARA